jgi:hypothetical protein
VYTQSAGVWTQQGSKLVGTGAVGSAQQGQSVSLSSDGNTLAIGGWFDDTGVGATWIFTRSLGVWTQQGSKLIGTGAIGTAYQGRSVSLSADGNTLAVGGAFDDYVIGATWIFTRSLGVWTQQAKLVGNDTLEANQGYSISLSGDGNTLAVGGYTDEDQIGATWIFTRSLGVWTQQGSKLVGTGGVGFGFYRQGFSVSLSSDGNTVAIGGHRDNAFVGATWIFTRSLGVWTQQGSKLVGTGNIGLSRQGFSVSLSSDGNTVAIGGSTDNTNVGAIWIFTRSAGVWTQKGSKLIGTGATGGANQGSSVSISPGGSTIVIGGSNDATNIGATWVIACYVPPTSAPSFSPSFSPTTSVPSKSPSFSPSKAPTVFSPNFYLTTAGSTQSSNNDAVASTYWTNGGVWNKEFTRSGANFLSTTSSWNSITANVVWDSSTTGPRTIWLERGNDTTQANRMCEQSLQASNKAANVLSCMVLMSASETVRLKVLDSGNSASLVATTGARFHMLDMTNTVDTANYYEVKATVSQNIPENTAVILTTYWTGSPTSAGITYNSGTGLFTIAATGYYMINYNVCWATNSVGLRSTWMERNSDTTFANRIGFVMLAPHATRPTCITQALILSLTAGNTLRSYAYHQAGGATIALDFASGPRITIMRLNTPTEFYQVKSGTAAGPFTPNNDQALSTYWDGGAVTSVGSGITRSTGIFTVTTPGYYAIRTHIQFGGATDSSLGTRAIWLVRGTTGGGEDLDENNRLGYSASQASSGWTILFIAVDVYLNAGDTIRVYLRSGHTSGTVTLDRDWGVTFTMCRLFNSGVGPGVIAPTRTPTALPTLSPTFMPTAIWTLQNPTSAAYTGTGQSGAANMAFVRISADGNTVCAVGYNDNSGRGAVWMFLRTGTTWAQEGSKLTCTGCIGSFQLLVCSVQGDTLIVGVGLDNTYGSALVFLRDAGVWTQNQRLVGPGGIGNPYFCSYAVSLSENGQTFACGGRADNTNQGAVWIYSIVSGGIFQFIQKLTVSDNVGASEFGTDVMLSSDGLTLAALAIDSGTTGRVHIFKNIAGTWTKIVKIIPSGLTTAFWAHRSNAISGDGKTVCAFSYPDNANKGAVWVFVENAGVWTMLGAKKVPTPTSSPTGVQVCGLDRTGTVMLIGTSEDTGGGGFFVYNRPGHSYDFTQSGSKYFPSGSGATQVAVFGAINMDGNTIVAASSTWSSNAGGFWVYVNGNTRSTSSPTQFPTKSPTPPTTLQPTAAPSKSPSFSAIQYHTVRASSPTAFPVSNAAVVYVTNAYYLPATSSFLGIAQTATGNPTAAPYSYEMSTNGIYMVTANAIFDTVVGTAAGVRDVRIAVNEASVYLGIASRSVAAANSATSMHHILTLNALHRINIQTYQDSGSPSSLVGTHGARLSILRLNTIVDTGNFLVNNFGASPQTLGVGDTMLVNWGTASQAGVTRVSNTFVIATTGWYIISSYMMFQTQASGTRYGWITKNNDNTPANRLSYVGGMITVSTGQTTVHMPIIQQFTAGDVLRVWAYTSVGVDLLQVAYTSFAIYRLRATPTSYADVIAGSGQTGISSDNATLLNNYWTGTSTLVGITLVNGVFTITEAGWYTLRAVIELNTAAGLREAWFVRNGDTALGSRIGMANQQCIGGGFSCNLNILSDIFLEAGDTISVYVRHVTAGPTSISLSIAYGPKITITRLFDYLDPTAAPTRQPTFAPSFSPTTAAPSKSPSFSAIQYHTVRANSPTPLTAATSSFVIVGNTYYQDSTSQFVGITRGATGNPTAAPYSYEVSTAGTYLMTANIVYDTVVGVDTASVRTYWLESGGVRFSQASRSASVNSALVSHHMVVLSAAALVRMQTIQASGVSSSLVGTHGARFNILRLNTIVDFSNYLTVYGGGANQAIGAGDTLVNALWGTPTNVGVTYSAGVFTIGATGWYLVSTYLQFSSQGLTSRALWITLNNDDTSANRVGNHGGFIPASSATGSTTAHVAVIRQFTAGNTLRVKVNTGTAVDLLSGNSAGFAIYRLRATPTSYADIVAGLGQTGIVSGTETLLNNYWTGASTLVGITHSNGVFTVTEAGWYAIRAYIEFDNGIGLREAWVVKNGDTALGSRIGMINQQAVGSPYYLGFNVITEVFLEAGDTVAIYVRHVTSGPTSISLTTTYGGRITIVRLFDYLDTTAAPTTLAPTRQPTVAPSLSPTVFRTEFITVGSVTGANTPTTSGFTSVLGPSFFADTPESRSMIVQPTPSPTGYQTATAGWVLISGNVYWEQVVGTIASRRNVWVEINGDATATNRLCETSLPAAPYPANVVHDIVSLSASAILRLIAYQDSTGARNVLAGRGARFQILYINNIVDTSNLYRIKSSGTQSIPNNSPTPTPVTYFTGAATTSPGISVTSGVFTMATTGYYLVDVMIDYVSNSVGGRRTTLLINNAVTACYVSMRAISTDRTVTKLYAILSLTASDNLRLTAFQNSGGSLNIQTLVNPVFSIVRLNGFGEVFYSVLASTATQSIAAAVDETSGTAITTYWDGAVTSVANGVNQTSPGIFTFLVSGWYSITANVGFASDATANTLRAIWVVRNGQTGLSQRLAYSGYAVEASTPGYVMTALEIAVQAGDTFQVYARQDTAGAITLDSSLGGRFSAVRLLDLSSTPTQAPTSSLPATFYTGRAGTTYSGMTTGAVVTLPFSYWSSSLTSSGITTGSTTRFIVPVMDYYMISANPTVDANAAGERNMWLLMSSTVGLQYSKCMYFASDQVTGLAMHHVILAPASAYFEFGIYTDSGGTRSMVTTHGSRITILRMSGALDLTNYVRVAGSGAIASIAFNTPTTVTFWTGTSQSAGITQNTATGVFTVLDNGDVLFECEYLLFSSVAADAREIWMEKNSDTTQSESTMYVWPRHLTVSLSHDCASYGRRYGTSSGETFIVNSE